LKSFLENVKKVFELFIHYGKVLGKEIMMRRAVRKLRIPVELEGTIPLNNLSILIIVC